MTNQNQTAADKSAAANAELNATRHRITALEGSEATRAANVQRARIKLARLTNLGTEQVERETLTAFIAEQTGLVAAEKVERDSARETERHLILKVGALAVAVSSANANEQAGELAEARAAWAAVIEPNLAVAERLRTAIKAAGLHSYLPSDAHLLSGGGKQLTNV